MPHPDFSQTLSKDRHFLQSAFKNPNKYGGLSKVEEKYQKSHEIFLKRLAALPKPEFDNTLPVHEKLEEIKKAIAENQVTIICGETGSGKTTQLPKICLELGRGAAGLIGHTQPRRLAARSVAERIAEELHTEIGSAVGYKVRFTDHTSRDACVKLMTDGILLAETQTDRYLAAYDTIIIDEAHERSLNIDFLLGYLKQLLPRRPDLKVIITSATIDAERFSQHFNGAPVLEVSGRTYPVEILYRPLTSKDEDDAEVELTDAIVDAADELARHGEGDILVFLPGEREIREAAEALRKSTLRRNDEILPLFARLSHAEQHKIFHPTGAKRRIVLATNVAETSLTVPGIKYVIDTGLARVKRYSARAKVEQLHVEKISQAAARQRSGRCGRVSAGVCIRLFSEEDFNSRPEFTDPEIVRSNLAAVILRMAALKLGDVAAFPFLEMPDSRYINDGFQVLLELGAVNEHNGLTKLGEQMARLPIDPKIARILLAAKKHDCMAEILVIASALSIQDPRERPLEARDAAAKAHERFTDKQSDFLAYLNIWDSFQRERDKGLPNKQLVQWCRQYFLSHLRMREWRELHHQLAQTAIEMGLTTKEAAFRRPPEVRQLTSSENAGDQDLSAKLKQKQLDKKQHRAQIRAAKEAGYEQIHRALLTGLIANVGMKSPDGNDYTGARGSRFHLFPASALFKAKPKWVMAAELVETTKLYARDVAAIQPEWIEQEAPHLVRYHYFEPHWEQKRGEVVASERVTLYGLTVLPRRPVSYGRVAPEEAREIFIRSALVAQECDLKAEFFVHNKKLIKEITELEHKSRRQDVLVDDEVLFAFYHERLPDFYKADAVSSSLHPANPQQTAPSYAREERREGKTVATQTNFSAAAANPLPTPLPQEREQSAVTSTFSDDLRPANPQQTSPSCAGEDRGEGKTVAAQTNFSATAASPLPNPLPQEREQSTAVSTVSDDPKAQRLPENSLCYADGQPILLGDRVTIDSKQWHGKIVALIAEQQCDPSIGSAEEWAILQSGVMAQFDEAGLVHYPDAETAGELILLARADVTDVLKSQKHNVECVAQATHADSKDTDNCVREPSSHTLQNVSDDPTQKAACTPKKPSETPPPRRHPHLPSLAPNRRARQPAPAVPQSRRPHAARRRAHYRRTIPQTLANRRRQIQTQLPLRAAPPARRRYPHPAAHRAQPHQPRRPRMARARHDTRKNPATNQSTAQTNPPYLRTRARIHHPIFKPKPRPQRPHPAPTRPSHRQNRRRHPHTRANQPRRMGRVQAARTLLFQPPHHRRRRTRISHGARFNPNPTTTWQSRRHHLPRQHPRIRARQRYRMGHRHPARIHQIRPRQTAAHRLPRPAKRKRRPHRPAPVRHILRCRTSPQTRRHRTHETTTKRTS